MSLTDTQLLNSTMPPGTCTGWPQPVPITLKGGEGSALNPDGSFAGSSMMEVLVLGRADIDGDGRKDVVLRYTCFGGLPGECCAGQASMERGVAVFADEPSRPMRRIGPPLVAGERPLKNSTETVHLGIKDAKLDGATIVTTQFIYYPHHYTAEQLGQDPNALTTARHVLREGAWHLE